MTIAFAQDEAKPKPAPEPAIEQIKRSVVYIIGRYGSGAQVRESAGTGFIIYVPESRLGADRGLLWLVTSKHVIREPRDDGTDGPFFKEVLVRFNLKEPRKPDGRQFDLSNLEVLDGRGNLKWFVDPDDPMVDLAMTHIQVNEAVVDAKWVPSSWLATRELIEARGINENDDIFFTGLFDWYPGVKKNYPIVRHGKIALLPKERIPVNRERQDLTANLYLAEVTSFGGNSGSPVFIRVGGVREGSGGPTIEGYSYLLLGVMQGFFPEAAPVAVETKILRGTGAQNSGIALVVPSEEILHILGSPAVKAYVESTVRESVRLRGEKPN